MRVKSRACGQLSPLMNHWKVDVKLNIILVTLFLSLAPDVGGQPLLCLHLFEVRHGRLFGHLALCLDDILEDGTYVGSHCFRVTEKLINCVKILFSVEKKTTTYPQIYTCPLFSPITFQISSSFFASKCVTYTFSAWSRLNAACILITPSRS